MELSVSVTLAGTVAVLVAAGVYLLLSQSLSRLLLGVVLLGNGANLLILATSGRAGRPPILGGDGRMSDPLPQVMILTAIVITLGMTAFLLATAYRYWQLTGDDVLQDDVEARRLAGKDRCARTGASDESEYEPQDEPRPGGTS